MFCLRSWIPIFFFLTNASPIYLVLFITATYSVNRPCVYCSLLLAILLLALFDFRAASTAPSPTTMSTGPDNWFEPRYRRYAAFSGGASSASTLASPANSTAAAATNDSSAAALAALDVGPIVRGSLAVLSSAVNQSVAAAARTMGMGMGMGMDMGMAAGNETAAVSGLGVGAWFRSMLRREWRIECLDVVVRL